MLVGDEWVPQGTPQGNLQQLAQIRSRYSASQSSVSPVVVVGPTAGAGFTALAAPGLGHVVVDKVVPTSPANRAGLYPGDRLLAVDGRSVQGLGPQQLADLVVKPDGTSREVTLQVRRGESLVDVTLQTQRMEEFADFLTILGRLRPRGKRASACKVGLDVFVADGPRQVIVTGVDYPSPAFKEGLHVGDLILAANGRPVEQIARTEWPDLLNPAASSRLALEISRLDRKLALLVPALTEAEAQAEIGRSMTKDGPASPHCGEPPKPN
jgi:C-terminal processing protease CtpA/Prc